VSTTRFPIEAGHVLLFARSIGDPNPVYADPDSPEAQAVDGVLAPPTFVQASAQFNPDYPLRPRIGQPWFGSGREPTGRVGRATRSNGEARSGSGAGGGSGGAGGSSGSGGGNSGGGGGSGLHAEQHYEYHRTPRVGDVLTATTRPGERWEKAGRRGGKLLFAESITEFRDEDGELVVTARAVTVRTERPVDPS
jgi:hypothetical protein